MASYCPIRDSQLEQIEHTFNIVFSAVRETSPSAERRSADLSFITSRRKIEIYLRSELLDCEMSHTLQIVEARKLRWQVAMRYVTCTVLFEDGNVLGSRRGPIARIPVRLTEPYAGFVSACLRSEWTTMWLLGSQTGVLA